MLDRRQIARVDGALADLGVSSMQFDAPGRGFSFQRDEPLDMRMDRSGGDTAADLVARSTERELADAIFQFGEERFSRRIARAIVEARREAPIGTTGRLARHRPPRDAAPRLHAHRSGDANVPGAAHLGEPRARRARSLRRGGGAPAAAGARLVVIAFHSLEDRIVKHTLRALQQRDGCVAGADEEADRAGRRGSRTPTRDAQRKLRAAERIA